jgi:hypothetical protein
MNDLASSIDDKHWEEIILQLTAFTHYWTKGKPWFRGKETKVFLEGKEVKDYVFAAIGKYLEEPEKYNSSKGELVEYLKYQIIRSLIINDLRKKENLTSVDIFAYDDEDENDESIPYSERIMPYIETSFPDDIDYASIKSYIEKEIKGDTDAENILLGVYSHGMKRRDIIAEFNMTPAAYDNGMRRLATAINRAALHFKN